MKIPKEIENALKERAKAAETLREMDYIITKFIMDNGIEVSKDDYLTGCAIYIEPQGSADRVRQAIRAKECEQE